MTTDHYAEAERLLFSARDLASIRDADPEMRDRAVMATVAESQVHATLALTDAVRALKAGATVTTRLDSITAPSYRVCGADDDLGDGRRFTCTRPVGHPNAHSPEEDPIGALHDIGWAAGFTAGRRLVNDARAEEAPRG